MEVGAGQIPGPEGFGARKVGGERRRRVEASPACR